MALRNAFEGLATEGTLRRLLAVVSYARDSSDRLRVQVDNQPAMTVYARNDGTNGYNTQTSVWFSAGAVFAVDEREQQRIQSEQNFNAVRMNRWTFS